MLPPAGDEKERSIAAVAVARKLAVRFVVDVASRARFMGSGASPVRMQGKPGLAGGVWSILDSVNGRPASLGSEGFEELIHGSRGGSNTWLVELVSTQTMESEPWSAKSKSNTKSKNAGEEEKQKQPPTLTPPRSVLDNADLVYMAKKAQGVANAEKTPLASRFCSGCSASSNSGRR